MSWATNQQAAQEWDGTYTEDLKRIAKAAMPNRSFGDTRIIASSGYELGQRLYSCLTGVDVRIDRAKLQPQSIRRILLLGSLRREKLELTIACDLWDYEVMQWWARQHPEKPDGMH